MITLKGSNQHKTRRRMTVLESVLTIGILATGITAWGIHDRQAFIKNAISPLADPVYAAETATTPTPKPVPGWVTGAQTVTEGFSQFGVKVTAQALDVAQNESGWKSDAQNWNCWYSADGTVKSQKTESTDVSTSCREQDKPMAWSVDCGLLQINVSGKTCPADLFDPKKNVAKAVEMYKRRGWTPWVAAKKLGFVK